MIFSFQGLAYAYCAKNKAGNSQFPNIMGALDNSEPENKFAILFLLGGSSRLAGCHGIWTQHDGPHLSGGKQQ